MKKRILSFLLAIVMIIPMVVTGAYAAGPDGGLPEFVPEEIESDYFRNQLNDRAKAIYDMLLEEFSGENKEQYYEGTKSIDISVLKEITDTDIANYLAGNKEIFNDFSAAKDALDLDHSELWWIDSGYLSFRVTKEEHQDGKYHVLIGPGRGKTYLLGGGTIENVGEKDAALQEIVNGFVEKAKAELKTVNANHDYSIADQKAALVRAIHTYVTEGLSYRYETECVAGAEPYIRTLYALANKQGVCEAYSRAMQVCLTKLGIECVLVHGVQTKGTPENHMWNAVNIPDDGAEDADRWYVVDATWDDPVPVDWYGKRDLKDNQKLGKDETETVTYLMVGQNVVGEHWRPSGFVSTGMFEFKYPTIETSSFNGSTAFGSSDSLKVEYSAGVGNMEDGTPAGVFTVTFQGMNMKTAAENGFYFLLRMHDIHADGTSHVMHDWYYANAALLFLARNQYFFDGADGLHVYTGTCEYVEVAVTTRKPDGYDEWEDRTDWSYDWLEAYYNGDESDFVAESGMLYNTNASYEAPPYVYRQTPASNGQTTAGCNYRVDVIYDDELYHPTANSPASIDTFVDNSSQAAKQTVRVRYTTYQQDLHTGGDMIAAIAGELPFDTDRDGYVDMDASNSYVEFAWHYVYAEDMSKCPNADGDDRHVCDVEKGCRINGVTFNFRASDMWQDDVTQYQFQIEGVVGSRSNKFANPFDIYAMVPGLCPACYRSQGIDWNLWGKPTLLDAPENLDLAAMAAAGGTDEETLNKLQEEMNTSDLNGRLMLVVEDKTPGAGNREDYQRIESALEASEEGKEIEGQEVLGRSVFEINFNRICPMVKLKPGESLRVQVGYPAGITYEMLTAEGSDVQLKAYHFTRCDEKHDCGKSNEEGHKWGQDIVSVEEITLIPTPYGMVIMCDAFSPFEIVALKSDTPVSAPASTSRELIVVSDGNGYVEVEDVKAVGENGNIEFTDSTAKTFRVVANEGYVVDTVSLGGQSITVGELNTFILNGSDVKSNDVLSVTFIPADVKEEEADTYGATVVAAVCPHTRQKIEVEEEKATCTKGGHTARIVCEDCHMVLQESVDTPAAGHTPVVKEKAVAATCTTDGKRAKTVCSVCGETIEEAIAIPTTGHQFSEYETQTRTCQGAIKTATCDICHEAVNQITDPAKAIDHDFSVPAGTKTPATCVDNRVDLLKCQWCNETKEVIIPDSTVDHTPDETGVCTVCKEFMCKEGHTYVPVKGHAATCTEPGLTDGEVCSVCGHESIKQEIIPALGHDFGEGHTKGTKCSRCETVLSQDNHVPTPIDEVEATCTTQGSKGGTKCALCGEIIDQPTVVDAIGHEWNTEDVSWVWSEDGAFNASVTFSCTKCGHTETVVADVTEEITQDPTCEDTGIATFVAKATFNGQTYTDTKLSAVIPAKGHNVKEWAPDKDATCTVHGHDVGTCTVCGQEVKREREELLPHSVPFDGTVEIPATCDEPGRREGRCVMCDETVIVEDESTPALGHDWDKESAAWSWSEDNSTVSVTFSCSRDASHTTTVEAEVSETVMKQPTCTSEGMGAFVATATFDGEEYTDTKESAAIPALGHSFSCYRTVTPATCTETGYARSTCYRCGASHSRVLPALGHDFVDGICSRCGLKDPDAVYVNPFKDIPDSGAWFSDSVEYVVKRQLMVGMAEDNFGATLSTTRKQVTAILARLGGAEEPEDPSQWDVAGMKWAVENGISDGSDPDGVITREQFLTMLWRFMDSPESTQDLSAFADADKVSAWARPAIAWGYENGLIAGMVVDGKLCLCPHDTAIRVQTATFLHRFCETFDL